MKQNGLEHIWGKKFDISYLKVRIQYIPHLLIDLKAMKTQNSESFSS